MIFRCRQFEIDDTERAIDTDYACMAPDEYVRRHVDMGCVGATTYIEVRADEEWALWSVECIFKEGGLESYYTERVTVEDVRREIQEYRERVS